MKLPFCEMFFLFYLHPTNRFNVAKFHAQMSTKLKKQRHWFNAHSLKSFKTLLGPFRLNSQEVVRAPSPIFLKFYSNCHYPVWWTSAIFERYLWRNGMNIKLFSWGDVNYSYLAMFKALLLPNYIISGILVTLPNIEKITLSILWLPKVKGHGPPKLTVSSFCYKFSKIFKPCHGFISWQFSLIFGRIVADKIIFHLKISSSKFYCKISKGLWDILGRTWHEMKKLVKWGTFGALVPQSWVNLLISQTFWYFAIKFSKVKDNFITNKSSTYERKLSRNKTVAKFENL